MLWQLPHPCQATRKGQPISRLLLLLLPLPLMLWHLHQIVGERQCWLCYGVCVCSLLGGA